MTEYSVILYGSCFPTMLLQTECLSPLVYLSISLRHSSNTLSSGIPTQPSPYPQQSWSPSCLSFCNISVKGLIIQCPDYVSFYFSVSSETTSSWKAETKSVSYLHSDCPEQTPRNHWGTEQVIGAGCLAFRHMPTWM